MAVVETTFVLVGANAGKTVALGGRQFTDGSHTATGPEEELKCLGRFLARAYQAFPEGSEELTKAQEALNGGDQVQADGSVQDGQEGVRGGPGSDTEGAEETPDGGSDAGAETGEAGPDDATGNGARSLAEAVQALDPENDDHWTNGGQPKVDAVASQLGRTDVTRAQVEAAAPGYNREVARGEEA